VRWIGFSPDGLHMLGSRRHGNIVLDLLDQQFSSLGPFVHRRPQLFEIETGRPLYSMPMALPNNYGHPATSCGWSHDRSLLAVAGNDAVAVWDLPPRKSLTWFAVGTGLLTCPLAILARRRNRRELARESRRG